jgi:hypothetical protein
MRLTTAVAFTAERATLAPLPVSLSLSYRTGCPWHFACPLHPSCALRLLRSLLSSWVPHALALAKSRNPWRLVFRWTSPRERWSTRPGCLEPPAVIPCEEPWVDPRPLHRSCSYSSCCAGQVEPKPQAPKSVCALAVLLPATASLTNTPSRLGFCLSRGVRDWPFFSRHPIHTRQITG